MLRLPINLQQTLPLTPLLPVQDEVSLELSRMKEVVYGAICFLSIVRSVMADVVLPMS